MHRSGSLVASSAKPAISLSRLALPTPLAPAPS
jgi:hypothetical protein